MLQKIKSLLIAKGWYNNVKYSRSFRLYQLLFKPKEIREEKRELAFYRSFLSPCKLIFDIGGYDGHKTVAFLSIGEKVICCEPDPENIKILSARFRNISRVVIESTAISSFIGSSTLLQHEPGSAFNTINPKWKETLESDQLKKWNERITFSGEKKEVSVTTLDTLIEKYGIPGFIKIDTEGSEADVLAGLHHEVPCLSIECMLPDFKPELLQCLDKLMSLYKAPTFAIAIEEKITDMGWMSIDQLKEWIEETDVHHFELIARSSG